MKYRPSSGSEGCDFIAHWCDYCLHDQDYREGGDSCPIVAATFCHEVNDPLYPAQWEYGPHGPRCTAFLPVGDDLEITAARSDPRQMSLFGTGVEE